MITGSMVAVVTPMRADGSLDLDAYRALIDWHADSGTAAIVAVGTTGESPTVDVDEHLQLIRVAVEQSAGRIPVVAGTGANSTAEALHLTKMATDAGADMTLQVAPYYNKPTQEGLYQHYRVIAEEGGLPVILYNVPGRTVADIADETVLRLAELPRVVGLKDATGDLGRGAALIAQLPDDFAVYSGNDDSALALMAVGGKGVISVTANVAPTEMAQMCTAALAGDLAAANAINRRLMGLHRDLFVEANPIPVKWAVSRMGRCGDAIRLPLTVLDAAYQPLIEGHLRDAGLL